MGPLPRRATLPALLGLALLPDLEVAIPPGPPLEWSASFPAVTPDRAPLFPETGSRDEERTQATPAPAALDPRVADAEGLVRILTWDVSAHVAWIGPPSGPRTGADLGAEFGEPLYWMSAAPLLRLLLHPGTVSAEETLAHLVEIGEPTLGVARAARAEASLSDVCARLARAVEVERDGAPVPPPKDAPARARMLGRFVQEELSAAHPHDPEGAFGARLFLFADEALPYVVEAARSPHARTRRNAAAALGRYRTPAAAEALVALAAEADDPVVLVRALAGVGAYQGRIDRTPLVERLARTKDPLERVALAGALGRAGVAEAAPVLVALAEGAPDDVDLLQAVLVALARIRPVGDARALELARAVRARARKSPKELRPRGPAPSLGPDLPDSPDARAEVLDQLALLLLARLDLGDGELAAEVAALVQAPDGGRERPRATTPLATNDALARVHPPARFLWLETLGLLGERGRAALRLVVEDGTADAALRARALRELPLEERVGIAASWCGDEGASPGLRLHGLRLLAESGDRRFEEVARRVVEDGARLSPAAAAPSGASSSAWRCAWDRERGLFRARDLLPLVHLVKRPSAPSEAQGRIVRERVRDLVRAAQTNEAVRRLERGVDELLELVRASGANRRLASEEVRAGARAEIVRLLHAAAARRGDERYGELLVESLVSLVLGGEAVEHDPEKGGFEPRVLLEEELVLALGRTRERAAVELLLHVLRDEDGPHRGVACLAVGAAGVRSVAPELLPFLGDEDGFVRFAAHEALRHLLGSGVDVDWIGADPATLAAAAEKYAALVRARRT